MKDNISILFLSDIHWKNEYEEDKVVTQWWDSLFRKIDELHKKLVFRVICLGGDMAYSGSSDEYSSLKKILASRLPRVPIISVVGNHDVDWTYLKESIGDSRPLNDLFGIEKSVIIDNIESYSKSFAQYKSIFYNEFVKKHASLADTQERKYDDKLHCGYFFDRTHKFIIILFNSCWYSFGPGVIKKYFEQLLRDHKSVESLRPHLVSLLGEKLSQRGKQSYFLDYYPYYEDIVRIYEEYPDVHSIALVHHPIDWLNYEEGFEKSDESTKRVDYLLNTVDIIVTGHDHAVFDIPNLVKDECHHIPLGALLEYDYLDEYKNRHPSLRFPRSSFSVVHLERSKFKLDAYILKISGGYESARQKTISFEWVKVDNKTNGYRYKVRSTGDPHSGITETDGSDTSEDVFRFYHPRDKLEIQEIMMTKRNLPLQDNGDKDYTDTSVSKVYCFKKDEEIYFVSANSIDQLYAILQQGDMDQVENSDFFKFIVTECQRESAIKAVVALYVFIEADSPAGYEGANIKYFTLYQSITHKLKSEYFHILYQNGINIVYDCVNVSYGI